MTPDRERSMGSGDWPPLPIRMTQADLDACLLVAARHGVLKLRRRRLRPTA